MSNLYPRFGFASAGPGVVAASVPDYFDRQRDIRSFEEQALYRRVSLTLGVPDGAERVNALRATPSFYRLLGAAPNAGRAIAEEDGEAGNDAKVMVSYNFWQRRYGGDRSLVGRDIRLDGTPFRVVGILARQLRVPLEGHRSLAAASFTADQQSDASRHSNNWVMIARLEAGCVRRTGTAGNRRAECPQRRAASAVQNSDPRRGFSDGRRPAPGRSGA